MYRVSELGFTAFMILKGCKLVGYESGYYLVECEKKLDEYRVEWINSDFSKFDKLLLDLKNFKHNGG